MFSIGSSDGNGPSYFSVETKAGETHYFGQNQDSTMVASNSEKRRLWLINRIEDVAGNYIEFKYKNNHANGELVLSQVLYTGNEQQSLSPYNSINFIYESDIGGGYSEERTDQRFSYLPDGSISRQTELLRSIKVLSHDQVSRVYQLHYDDLFNGTKVLKAFQECSYEGTSLKPVQFEYHNEQAGVTFREGFTMNHNWHLGQAADFDNDGVTEAAFGYSNKLIIAKEGQWNNPIHTNIPFNASMIAAARVADVTGDDKPDLIYGHNHHEWHVATMHSGEWRHYMVKGINDAHAYGTTFSDIDNDGYVDMIYQQSLTWKVAFGRGFSSDGYFFETPKVIHTNTKIHMKKSSPAYFIDIDGDGVSEIFARRASNELHQAMKVVVDSNRNVKFLPIADYLFEKQRISSAERDALGPNYYGFSHKLKDGREPTLVDINGDGLSDLIYPYGGYWNLRMNTGKGFGAVKKIAVVAENNGVEKRGPIRIVDYNADGIADVLLPTYQYRASLGYLQDSRYHLAVGGRIFYFDHTNQRVDFFRDFVRPDYASITQCIYTNRRFQRRFETALYLLGRVSKR